MQIVECNPETVAGLLKKNVEKFWVSRQQGRVYSVH